MTYAMYGAPLSSGDSVYFVGITNTSTPPIRGINGSANNLINFAAYPGAQTTSTVGGVGGSNWLVFPRKSGHLEKLL